MQQCREPYSLALSRRLAHGCQPIRRGIPAQCPGRGCLTAAPLVTRKWQRELDYGLIKEVWAYRDSRIAVRFAYESHDDSGNWFRSYGNENWEFDDAGLMRLRLACINDLPIKESERKYHWPLCRRPDNHPGLSDLGL